MDLTRDYIDGLSFTVKKDKYYLGSEVDDALDYIAGGVDALNHSLADERAREEKMAKVIVKLQNTTKQQQADLQAMEDEKSQIDLDKAQYTDEIARLSEINAGFEAEKAEILQAKADLEAEKAALMQEKQQLEAEKAALLAEKAELEDKLTRTSSVSAPVITAIPAPQSVAPSMDPEKMRLAAKAERFLAEYRATRETLIAELTALQSKRDNLQESINTIANEAAGKILAITKVDVTVDE